jgi:hypothetical protein
VTDVTEISVRARTLVQLFNSLDPSPFRDKDLDPEVEAFVTEWVRELPADAAFRIVVHLPREEARLVESENFAGAFAHYFEHLADAALHEWRELFRVGRRYLAIGGAVLITCLGASQLFAALIPNKVLAGIVEESLIIVGWVANWRPLEIYLYDWVPIRRRIRLYRRIAAAPVEIRSG